MDTNNIKSDKTNRINTLNKILELGNLTNSQRLYLNYADKLGLNINWLNEYVISENNNVYKINGLIWKYKYISLEDDIINNELLLELEYIKPYILPEKEKQLEEIKKQQQNLVIGSNLYIPLSATNTGYYISSGTSLNNIVADRYNLLTDEILFKTLDGQLENPKIKDSSEYGIRIVKLNAFITCYKFENPEFQMPQNINNPKIRLIIE